MKVQSTGLGKSVMIAHLHGLSMTVFDDEPVMQMTMESTEPLHWYIQVYMEPKDVRRAVVLGLKPSVVWKALVAILFGRFRLFSKGGRDDLPEPGAVAPRGGAKPAGPQAGQAEPKTGSVPPDAGPAPPGENGEGGVSPLAKLKG